MLLRRFVGLRKLQYTTRELGDTMICQQEDNYHGDKRAATQQRKALCRVTQRHCQGPRRTARRTREYDYAGAVRD